MKRKAKHCSDCGAELKRIHREGHAPYKYCASEICRVNNYVVKELEKRRILSQSLPSGIPDAVLRNLGGRW